MRSSPPPAIQSTRSVSDQQEMPSFAPIQDQRAASNAKQNQTCEAHHTDGCPHTDAPKSHRHLAGTALKCAPIDQCVGGSLTSQVEDGGPGLASDKGGGA